MKKTHYPTFFPIWQFHFDKRNKSTEWFLVYFLGHQKDFFYTIWLHSQRDKKKANRIESAIYIFYSVFLHVSHMKNKFYYSLYICCFFFWLTIFFGWKDTTRCGYYYEQRSKNCCNDECEIYSVFRYLFFIYFHIKMFCGENLIHVVENNGKKLREHNEFPHSNVHKHFIFS